MSTTFDVDTLNASEAEEMGQKRWRNRLSGLQTIVREEHQEEEEPAAEDDTAKEVQD